MQNYSDYRAPFQAPREPLWSFPTPDKLPHNIEAEQALLGAMFLSVEACLKVFPLIETEDFFEPLHQRIYAAIRAQAQQGKTPTPITLKPFFEYEEKLGDITVHQYLGRLVAHATTIINARDYAEAVKDCAQRRKMAAAAERMMDAVYGVTTSPADSAIETIGELDDLIASMRPERDRRMTLYAAAHKAIDDAKAGQGTAGVTTGLADLDNLIGGLPKPGYTVIGARPSMGKSIMACHFALRAARKGSGVLLFSLEMEGGIVAMRNLSDAVWNQQTPIPIDTIKRWKQPEQEDRLRRAADGFRELPLHIDATPSLTTAEITARCRQAATMFEKQGKSLDLILIDHLGKIRASSRYAGQKVNETGEKSEALATLGKLTGAAVCAFSQLNRETEKRDDKRPTLADLRDTGDLEQDADLVIFLYRAAYYLERMGKLDDEEDERIRQERLASAKNMLELIIAKNRNGPCDTVNAYIDIANNVVRDAAIRPYKASQQS